jgi:inorganic pyrophosphatase
MAVIETPRGSNNKYELDKDTGAIMLDRVLHSPFFYPADYGFFPETLGDDGDPLDVLVLLKEPAFPGVILQVRPVGYLKMSDEKGMDEKVIAVAEGDPWYRDFKELRDLPKHMQAEIGHFFEQYKKNEKGKYSKIENWYGRAAAEKLIEKAMKNYQKDQKRK